MLLQYQKRKKTTRLTEIGRVPINLHLFPVTLLQHIRPANLTNLCCPAISSAWCSKLILKKQWHFKTIPCSHSDPNRMSLPIYDEMLTKAIKNHNNKTEHIFKYGVSILFSIYNDFRNAHSNFKLPPPQLQPSHLNPWNI